MDEQKETDLVKNVFITEDEEERKEEFNKRWLEMMTLIEQRGKR